MATVTLAESAKLTQNMLIAGVIESTVTVNRMYEVMPFTGIEGNALQYTREKVLGDVDMFDVGDKLGDGTDGAKKGKNPATFDKVSVGLTTIMGDAEVNGLIQATRSDSGNDQTAIQIASKAKSAGRQYQDQLVNGTGVSPEFEGLQSLVPDQQKVDTGADGSALTFELIDELMDKVLDKDGAVDYLMFHQRTIRSFKALLRGLGGAAIDDVITLPSGTTIPAYGGVPIFRNDYIKTNQTKGASTGTTTIFAGTFDDGAQQNGIAGLTARDEAGMHVDPIGTKHDADEKIYRVKWYCSMALFSELGVSSAEGIKN